MFFKKIQGLDPKRWQSVLGYSVQTRNQHYWGQVPHGSIALWELQR